MEKQKKILKNNFSLYAFKYTFYDYVTWEWVEHNFSPAKVIHDETDSKEKWNIYRATSVDEKL